MVLQAEGEYDELKAQYEDLKVGFYYFFYPEQGMELYAWLPDNPVAHSQDSDIWTDFDRYEKWQCIWIFVHLTAVSILTNH